MKPRLASAITALFGLLALVPTILAKPQSSTTSSSTSGASANNVPYTEANGVTVYLANDRKPALYTGNFGDCLGGASAINVTRFDAAYYKDNMTVLFHLSGETGLKNESLMMYIGVYAYGQSRFDLVFNPCQANIASLCPANSSVPIQAIGYIPVDASDVANIPSIALTIPDFEGEAVLRIFANSTETEIGCFSAVVTNGNTFSHEASVGSVLGVFTLVALLASFATAAYGEAVPTMRLHYAHSLSVGVVFAVFQHIFFTGALSLNWPSVLVAWWSNFAWAGGMVYSSNMQTSINHLIGNNVGNTSEVGAASAGSTQDSLGGGYDISQIYKRALSYGTDKIHAHPLMRDVASEIYRQSSDMRPRGLLQQSIEHTLQRRDLENSTTGYRWYGHPVGNGLPLPGNYSGFAGTLAQPGIRTSNAFMTGFLWFIILLVILVAALMAFKWIIEGFAKVKLLREGRFQYFRDHWLGYSAVLALRICYLGFFMMMFLTIFQFTYESSGGVKAIAAIVFIVFIIGIPGLAIYAVFYKALLDGKQHAKGRQVERKMLLGKIPWFTIKKTSTAEQDVELEQHDTKSGPRAFLKRQQTHGSVIDSDGLMHSIHDNEEFTTRFGWLAARFRRTRWWFFTAWLLYSFLEACFLGGGSGYPLAQTIGLLVVEILAFAFIVWARPFEGQRLNFLVVYALGFSKVTSVALAVAFDTRWNLDRIITTVIGIVIIVIQGILTILTLIAIIVGAISSYMSVSRNHESFRPKKWAGLRERYFNHLDKAVNDLPPEPKPIPVKESEVVVEPSFGVKSVRRMNKVEDEDEEFATEIRNHDPAASYLSLDERSPTPLRQASRAASIRSGANTPLAGGSGRGRAPSIRSVAGSLPYGARSHRPSWSTRDFEAYDSTANPFNSSRDALGTADDEPSVLPMAPKGGRAPNRSVTMPNSVTHQPSSETLRIGGDVSTRNSIGRVPAPTVRPRSGTHGSLRNSRASFGQESMLLGQGEAGKSTDWLSELSYLQAGSGAEDGSSGRRDRDKDGDKMLGSGDGFKSIGSRSARHSRVGTIPLTPAMELDEYIPPLPTKQETNGNE
ncbi:hypothetical protein LTR62_002261 [Meristemomyces frigidus]|uniref:ML-like domain-containing protein n=1 Tax=Meristemomyces frigidus TaxID=1508187 RepID=A0AAN7TGY3_9PEZI|nr:hypothetical protein LTR62_002261 [Meristemomyces frigidus]